jgi:hypothetical protein
MEVRYIEGEGRLDINVRIVNESSEPLDGITLFPLQLEFGGNVPVRGVSGDPRIGTAVDGPSVYEVEYGADKLVVAMTTYGEPVYNGLMSWNGTLPNQNYRIWLGTEPLPYQPESWPRFRTPVGPKSEKSFVLSLRFAPKETPTEALVRDVLVAFRDVFPPTLSWPDRRPIGRAMPAASDRRNRSPTNPRGWFNDPTLDVTTVEGLEQFRTRMLAFAEETIGFLRQIDAQGVITWDIEGNQQDPINYVGDPEIATILAPELAYRGTIDEYFARYRDAGFRVGVTIRPQRVLRTSAGNYVQQFLGDSDGVQALVDKIAYAKSRWNATLFYIDSNNFADQADALRRVAEAHGDVLLVPEHENTRTWAYAAPYNELRQGIVSTPALARMTYPAAASVICIDDVADLAAYSDDLVRSVRAGDILMMNAWYMNPAIRMARGLYRAAERLETP